MLRQNAIRKVSSRKEPQKHSSALSRAEDDWFRKERFPSGIQKRSLRDKSHQNRYCSTIPAEQERSPMLHHGSIEAVFQAYPARQSVAQGRNTVRIQQPHLSVR